MAQLQWGSGVRRMAACASVVLAACGSSPTVAPPPEIVRLAPTVELIAPGRAPLAPLRLKMSVGKRQRVALAVTMSIGVGQGLEQVPETTRLSTITLTCELAVVKLEPDGSFESTFRVVAAQVEPDTSIPLDVHGAMAYVIEPLVGLHGWSRTTDRGLPIDAHVEVPEAAPPETRHLIDTLQRALAQVTTPLPLEPVGPGARWNVTRDVTGDGLRNGLVVRQDATIELAARDGPIATLSGSLTHAATRQKLAGPDVPADVAVELTSLAGTGTAELVLDLRQLVPSELHIAMRTAAGTRTVHPQQGTVSAIVAVEMVVERVTAPP